MAWVEERPGGVFRVRARGGDGRQVVVAHCVSREEARRLASAWPAPQVDVAARAARREAVRSWRI